MDGINIVGLGFQRKVFGFQLKMNKTGRKITINTKTRGWGTRGVFSTVSACFRRTTMPLNT